MTQFLNRVDGQFVSGVGVDRFMAILQRADFDVLRMAERWSSKDSLIKSNSNPREGIGQSRGAKVCCF